MRITGRIIKHERRATDLKRRDLISRLEDAGYTLLRNGSRHDVYFKGSVQVQVPRHSEIDERTAKSILKKALTNRG